MEKRVALFIVVLLFQKVLCDIPSVFEFCNALLSEKSHCKGIQDEEKPPGPTDRKGSQGEQCTCEDVEERMGNIESEIGRRLDLIPKIVYCGMGIRSGDIQGEQITASSIYDYRHAAANGRLDSTVLQTTSTLNVGAWCARRNDRNQWIQIDLLQPRFVGGVVTQGRPYPNGWDAVQFVTTFKISFGNDTSSMSFLEENGQEKVFIGNTDQNSKVVNMFPNPVACRYIRLHPVTWRGHISLRMELLRGECFDLY